MSSSYRKIKYQEEGPYGSREDQYIYIWSHNTVDINHIYDHTGEEIFTFSETEFDMGAALAVAFTNWQDERMERLTKEDHELIKKMNARPDQLEDWAHIYDFNRQIYNGDHNIYVSKNDVDLHTVGGYSTYKEAEAEMLKYLNRINPKKK